MPAVNYRIKYVFLWLYIFLCFENIYSQDYTRLYDSLKKLPQIDLAKLTDSLIYLADIDAKYDEAAYISDSYSRVFFAQRKFNKSLFYVKKRRLYRGRISAKDLAYIKSTYNIGLLYRYNEQYDSAIVYMKELISLKPDQIRLARAYDEIARSFFAQGKFNESVSYSKKSISILEKERAFSDLYYSYTFNIDLNYRLGDSASINDGFRQAFKLKEISKKIPLTTSQQYSINGVIGGLYTTPHREDFNKALFYYKKNLNLGYQLNDSLIIGRSLINLGYLFNLKENDSAIFFIEKVSKYLNNEREDLVYNYMNGSQYYDIWDDPIKALEYINKSIQINIKLNDNVNFIPTVEELQSAINKQQIFNSLKIKNKLLVDAFVNYGNKDYFIQSNKISALVDELVVTISSYSSDGSLLRWLNEASKCYLYNAYAAHIIDNPNKAFSFMEKNKALLLSESVLKNTEFANLPRHVSEQETTFQKQVLELENELAKDEDNIVLQDSLFAAKQIHENYIDSLKSVYPKYFARKVNVDQIPLSEVQNELGNDGAVLSYIWNDFDRDTELIIGLVSTKDNAKTFEIKNVKELREKLNLYRKLVSQPFSTKDERDSFQSVAHELYSMLLPNEEVRSLVKGKHLTIIPDGDLQNIPFESLITKKGSNEYLILNGDINYSYSYSFLKHNEKVNRNTEQTFIGYSPNNFEALSLSSLNNSMQEVLNINDQFEGVTKLQDTATKKDFLRNSSNAKIVHLATHADVGKNPWIAFADDKLELHELYTFKNNADLVTLSACNTSLGELAKGEGVLSLARGFFYSGSKSVVSSMWKANDKSTSEIMTNFYKNLKSGQTKSEAINNAKRTYLTSHSLSEQSPYYWSSFILIGDPGSIDLPSNLNVYYFVALIIALAILFFRKKIKISG